MAPAALSLPHERALILDAAAAGREPSRADPDQPLPATDVRSFMPMRGEALSPNLASSCTPSGVKRARICEYLLH
jgi:hypothetical protein